MQRGWEWVDLFPFLPLSFLSKCWPCVLQCFLSTKRRSYSYEFNFKVSSFWSWGSEARYGWEEGGIQGLPGDWVSSCAHFIIFAIPGCAEFLGRAGGGLQFYYQQGSRNCGCCRAGSQEDIYSCSEWLWAHRGSGYASCLKVPGVLEPNPALVGQTVVNDKAGGCRMWCAWWPWRLAACRCFGWPEPLTEEQVSPSLPWSGLWWFPGVSQSWLHWTLANQSPLSLGHTGRVMLRSVTPKENAGHEFNFLISLWIHVGDLGSPCRRGKIRWCFADFSSR